MNKPERLKTRKWNWYLSPHPLQTMMIISTECLSSWRCLRRYQIPAQSRRPQPWRRLLQLSRLWLLRSAQLRGASRIWSRAELNSFSSSPFKCFSLFFLNSSVSRKRAFFVVSIVFFRANVPILFFVSLPGPFYLLSKRKTSFVIHTNMFYGVIRSSSSR